MIKAAHGGIAGTRNLGLCLLFRETLLEGFDALGDIPHDVGNLAFAAKHDQNDGSDNDPMPDRQTAHGVNLQMSTETAQSRPAPRKPRRSEPQKQAGRVAFPAIKREHVNSCSEGADQARSSSPGAGKASPSSSSCSGST